MNAEHNVWHHLRGLEPSSLCDWPGHPCSTLFLGSCNLKCPTCHNQRLAWDMESLERVPAAWAKSFLAERAGWIHGVTITGGEPTFVPGLGELLYELKRLGLPAKVDTNGMLPEVVLDILEQGLATQFAVDVKGPYGKYPQLTGGCVSEAVARFNLEEIFALAEQRPEAFYFRLTRVPCLTDADVQTARGYLPAGFELKIQKYVAPTRRAHATPDHETRRKAGDLVHG
jgi:pyruvate formate lyase activating enzyme